MYRWKQKLWAAICGHRVRSPGEHSAVIINATYCFFSHEVLLFCVSRAFVTMTNSFLDSWVFFLGVRSPDLTSPQWLLCLHEVNVLAWKRNVCGRESGRKSLTVTLNEKWRKIESRNNNQVYLQLFLFSVASCANLWSETRRIISLWYVHIQ